MLREVLLRVLQFAVITLPATAWAEESFKFTERRKTEARCASKTEPCEYPLVGKFKLRAVIDLPADSGAPRFDRDTPFELKFAGIDYEGTLGEDRKYRSGRRSCRIPLVTVEDEHGKSRILTVAALTWTSRRLVVTVAGKNPEDVVAAPYDGFDSGSIAETRTACVHLGSAMTKFAVDVTGSVATEERHIEDADGDVVDIVLFSDISVEGTGTPIEATDLPPSVTIATTPASPVYSPVAQIQAYADDDHGVERMAYRLDGGPEIDMEFSDGIKPGTGGAVDCEGARRATTTFDVDLGAEGHHELELIAYDAAGQRGSATAELEYRALRMRSLVDAMALDELDRVWLLGTVPTLTGLDDVRRLSDRGQHAVRNDGSVWR